MSELERLIQEHCPNGVSYLTLSEVCRFQNGFAFKSGLFKSEGSPILRITNIVDGKFSDDNYVYFDKNDYNVDFSQYKVPCGAVVVAMSGATTGKIGYNDSETEYYLNQRVGMFVPNTNVLSNRYLYHWLMSQSKNIYDISSGVGAQPNLSSTKMMEFLIPLPPIEIQREIVRILDNFTELTAELTAALTAELVTRKKQYEYYKCQLFNFDNIYVEMKPLGDEFSFIRNGFVGTATPYYTSKDKGVRYLKGTNIHNGVISDNEEEYITPEFHQKHIKNQLKPDDILVVQSGHVGECAVVGEKYAGANCHALIIMSNDGNCNSKYVVYYLQTAEGKQKLARITTGGTIKHILASGMKKLVIPFPSIDVQNKIVEILDRYDVLCNDISAGLPAEIEARQKQYEYYRDKLLTFKELGT